MGIIYKNAKPIVDYRQPVNFFNRTTISKAVFNAIYAKRQGGE